MRSRWSPVRCNRAGSPPGEQLCAAGDASDRIWLITRRTGETGPRARPPVVARSKLRMRKGDVIGAQDVITQTERTATVFAATETQTLELDAAGLLALAARFPQILVNVIQSQRERLFRASAPQRGTVQRQRPQHQQPRRGDRDRGPGRRCANTISALAAAARAAEPARRHRARPLAVVRRCADALGMTWPVSATRC